MNILTGMLPIFVRHIIITSVRPMYIIHKAFWKTQLWQCWAKAGSNQTWVMLIARQTTVHTCLKISYRHRKTQRAAVEIKALCLQRRVKAERQPGRAEKRRTWWTDVTDCSHRVKFTTVPGSVLTRSIFYRAAGFFPSKQMWAAG